LGRRSLVDQYDNATAGSGTLVDEVKFTYDDWGPMSTLEQDHNGAVNAGHIVLFSANTLTAQLRVTKGTLTNTAAVSVPAGVTSVEKRAVRDAALKAGAKEAYLIEEPLAAAIGANVPISGPSGNMIIDIGGGTSEIAVIALGGIVVSHSLRVGGNRFDESIATYIRKKYNLMVGERTAEEVKIQIGTALPLDRELTMEVRGRDLIAGLPRTIPITSSEVMEAIEAPLQQLVAAVRSVLEQTPPELSSDIIDKGMVMSGGGALLRNVDKLLTQVTGVPCHVAENPLSCVALGTGLALEHFDFFKKSLVQQI
jgi:rod shape-determining protein MreB